MEKHTGGCHCKKVQYEVDVDLTQPSLECNCSHCSVKGLLLQFVPESAFELKSGEDSLTEYRFNTEKIRHLFCKVCGVESFAYGSDKEGNKLVAINVRALEGIDLDTIPRKKVDGKSF